MYENISDAHRQSIVEDGRSQSQQERRSLGCIIKRPRYLVDGGIGVGGGGSITTSRPSSRGSRGHGEDEDTLRQLLLE